MLAKESSEIFLCPYCSESCTSHDDLRTHVLVRHGGERIPGPDDMISMIVNRKSYSLRVDPGWTLYYLIHDMLGLSGSKQFCDRGMCGSCTVIMNGRPVLSCMVLAVEADGCEIETVEGIAEVEHPLIDTYVEHHAMQCGYCTPGFIATSKALLDRNPDPSEEEIRAALAGNLCRCGTYPQHPKAVRGAADIIRNDHVCRTGVKEEAP